MAFVLWSDRLLDGPSSFTEMPYKSYGEFVQEFKDKIGSYVPEDFDWDAHLGRIVFTTE